MRKNNPACYECPKNPSGIHAWMKLSGGRATCLKCKLVLDEADTSDVFTDIAVG